MAFTRPFDSRRTRSVAFRVAELGLVALAAAFSFGIYTELTRPIPDPLENLLPPALAPVETPARPRPLAYYAPIVTRHVFSPPKPAPPIEARSAPPAPYFTAKVLGTAPSDVDGKAFAILEVAAPGKPSRQGLYRVGDVIQGRAVDEIRWDEVVFTNGKEKLVLEVPVSKSEVMARLEGKSSSEPVGLLDPSAVSGVEPPPPARADSVYEGGVLTGLRVSAVVRGSRFAALGLRNGDLLTGIDGEAFADPIQALRRFRALASAREASLEVVRRGEALALQMPDGQVAEGNVSPAKNQVAHATSRTK